MVIEDEVVFLNLNKNYLGVIRVVSQRKKVSVSYMEVMIDLIFFFIEVIVYSWIFIFYKRLKNYY